MQICCKVQVVLFLSEAQFPLVRISHVRAPHAGPGITVPNMCLLWVSSLEDLRVEIVSTLQGGGQGDVRGE